jgi:hypothetical protein
LLQVRLGKREPLSEMNASSRKKLKSSEDMVVIENGEGGYEEMSPVKHEVSDYEKARLANIAERQAMFAKLKGDMMELKRSLAPKPKPRSLVRRTLGIMYSTRRDPVLTR